MKKINSKLENINLVIKIIRAKGAISKKDISSITGLSPATLTIICKQLLKDGVIIEKGEIAEKKAGRRKQLLELNQSYRYIIGIDVKPRKVDYCLTDITGNPIHSLEMKSKKHIKPDVLIDDITNKVEELIKITKVNREKILGMGISIIGRVDSELGKTLAPIGFWDAEVELVKELETRIELPTKLYNNVHSLAVHEAYVDLELENFFYIKYDRGIGGAAIVNNHISKGNNLSGEFGHSILDHTAEEYCPMCKRKGCLEHSVSTESITRKVIGEYSSEKYPMLSKLCSDEIGKINFDLILESAENGGVEECKLLRKSAKLIAISFLNVYSLISFDKIVLQGRLFNSRLYMDYIIGYLREYQLTDFSEKLIKSSLVEENHFVAPAINFIVENENYV